MSTDTPADVDPDFDASQVALLGVKLGTNTAASGTEYCARLFDSAIISRFDIVAVSLGILALERSISHAMVFRCFVPA
jgi:hypothetical protein